MIDEEVESGATEAIEDIADLCREYLAEKEIWYEEPDMGSIVFNRIFGVHQYSCGYTFEDDGTFGFTIPLGPLLEAPAQERLAAATRQVGPGVFGEVKDTDSNFNFWKAAAEEEDRPITSPEDLEALMNQAEIAVARFDILQFTAQDPRWSLEQMVALAMAVVPQVGWA